VDGALVAVAVFALGSPSLEYMEGILGHVKAEPYSLSFDGMHACMRLLYFYFVLSSSFHHMIAFRWIRVLLSASRTFFSLSPSYWFSRLAAPALRPRQERSTFRVPLTAEQQWWRNAIFAGMVSPCHF